jgi:hypothetical protein
MNDNMGLNIHDVRVSQTAQYSPTGQVQQVTVVTYWVGDHGPFTSTYGPGEGTSEKITSDMNHQVAELRRITHPEMG